MNTRVKNPELRQLNRALSRHKKVRMRQQEKLISDPGNVAAISLVIAHALKIEGLKQAKIALKARKRIGGLEGVSLDGLNTSAFAN